MSIEASVCPALTNDPPFLATNGKTCPGVAISFFEEFFLIAVKIVLHLSNVEIPVVTPFLASMLIVKAVFKRDWFELGINFKLNSSDFFLSSAKQINPLPCFAIKFTFSGVAFLATKTKSPSFSLFSSSTKIKIFPFLASEIIVSIFANLKFFFIFSY